MRIKLNGWQRIGIVLSVIWFVGFAWVGEDGVQAVWHGFNDWVSYCSEEQNRTGEKNAPWTKYQLENYKLCKWKGYELYGIMITERIAVDIGMIICSWLIAWLGTGVVRWIRRGFA
jgi:hypothetical protein